MSGSFTDGFSGEVFVMSSGRLVEEMRQMRQMTVSDLLCGRKFKKEGIDRSQMKGRDQLLQLRKEDRDKGLRICRSLHRHILPGT